MDTVHAGELFQLCDLFGVETSYLDIRGQKIIPSLDVLQEILAGLGVEDLSPSGVREALRCKKEEVSTPIPPVAVSTFRRFSFPLEYGWSRAWCRVSPVDADHGRPWEEKGEGILEVSLPDDFPWGYLRMDWVLEGEKSKKEGTTLLVYTPGRCTSPPAQRLWGTNVALYSLSTHRNPIGVGDLRDLSDLQETLRTTGAGFLGILPIHLLENTSPHGMSPYYPVDRMLWNPLYLPLDEVLVLHDFPPMRGGYDRVAANVANGPHDRVDYERVWKAKREFLFGVFEHFLEHEGSSRWREFEAFFHLHKQRVLPGAVFQVVSRKERRPWKGWAAHLQKPNEDALLTCMREHRREVLFEAYMQWLMEVFLERITARDGFIGFDLPVGASPGGSECWREQDTFVFSSRVGAPPDDFSPEGQNWGFPPSDPWRARHSGYRHFISLTRQNMRFSRFLRLDHIMGLARTFWIPEGREAVEGTYVRSYMKELMGIMALESHLNNTVVVGEDLGTVPDTVREGMAEHRILSTRVMYFEKDPNGGLRAPQSLPKHAFLTLNTHDMPSLRGFMEGIDLKARLDMGIFDENTYSSLWEERKDFLGDVQRKLEEWGLWNEGEEDDSYWPFFWSLVRYLSCAPSTLLSVGLEDVAGVSVQPNLPSTTVADNWTHCLPLWDELYARRLTRMNEMICGLTFGEREV